MNEEFIDQVYEKINYKNQALAAGAYDGCQFINCDFSSSDIGYIHFIDCVFTDCNLSSARITQTVFRDSIFKNCKMLGLHFDQCDHFLFAASFNHCSLNLSSFYQVKLKGTTFKTCNLQEVDFTEADLSAAIFDNCDLLKAVFENSILEKADLRSAFNYAIDPDKNRVRKARFSFPGIAGLLDKYDIDIS